MSFLDRVEACNRFDIANFIAFKTDGQTVGWLRPSIVQLLTSAPSVFIEAEDSVQFTSDLNSADLRTTALASVAEGWVAHGHLPELRGEMYPVRTTWLSPDLFRLDRTLAPFFGVRAYGVHLNGYVKRENKIYLWIGRRSADAYVEPGKFDNMVAGGQPASLSVVENLIKECAEEANIPSALARMARSTGTVTYCYDSDRGLKPHTLFCFDLELPEDFLPVNQDGEIEDFRLMALDDALAEIANSENFKFNVALVILDFAIRHGVLSADREPDFEAILRGLHAPPPSALA